MTYMQWMLIGLVLILMELATPGVYLIWFGLSAILIGVGTLIVEWNVTEQLVWFSFVSLIFAVLGWRVYKRVIRSTKALVGYEHLNDMASAYVGQVYQLTEDVVDGRSKIKVGDTVWLAECETPLKAGETVEVTGVSGGVVLKVKKYFDKK